eukprot:1152613-Pelagomonas_calceolata.AAC.4
MQVEPVQLPPNVCFAVCHSLVEAQKAQGAVTNVPQLAGGTEGAGACQWDVCGAVCHGGTEGAGGSDQDMRGAVCHSWVEAQKAQGAVANGICVGPGCQELSSSQQLLHMLAEKHIKARAHVCVCACVCLSPRARASIPQTMAPPPHVRRFNMRVAECRLAAKVLQHLLQGQGVKPLLQGQGVKVQGSARRVELPSAPAPMLQGQGVKVQGSVRCVELPSAPAPMLQGQRVEVQGSVRCAGL